MRHEKAIDWQKQWELHAPNFKEGFLPIGIAGKEVRLLPGPGFGNLSHPTTRLAVSLLPEDLRGWTALDIGCGSGILALCAAALGAEQVIGIDIDPEALQHARENARLNGMKSRTHFCFPKDCPRPVHKTLALMNMIRTEQHIAWKSIHERQGRIVRLITSGVLAEERSLYLDETTRLEWCLSKMLEQEGWLAFEFCRQGECDASPSLDP